MKPLLPFLVALQFLTRFPLHLPRVTDQRTIGRSLLYYPLVGLLLGVVLATLHWVLDGAPALLRAILVLTAWAIITGALHLDGLADSADAWVGGLGGRRRTLAIMKDPYCGPMAVVALMLVLLIKLAALHGIDPDDWVVLVLAPGVARGTVPLLFLSTPYVRPRGLGAALAANLPRPAAATVVAATAIAAVFLADGKGLWMLVAVGGTFLLLRGMMVGRLGGATGDTAGALIELSEAAMLVAAALS